MVLKLVEPAQPRDRFWGTMTDHHTYGTGTHTAGELVYAPEHLAALRRGADAGESCPVRARL
ncbi:hypothetical protein [Streptomyces sp. R35]|uniref:Uncharacterized protein n=1 Tax=Streptomyces sp. R35 TaxID=3238630 RepID=A0AB39SPE7_9ACTN